MVAVLPIGMCQVSSVIITAEPGVTVRKGEEISYFQFGGPDVIVLFEAKSNQLSPRSGGQDGHRIVRHFRRLVSRIVNGCS